MATAARKMPTYRKPAVRPELTAASLEMAMAAAPTPVAQLEYSIDPPRVQVSSSQNLTLTIQNPSEKFTITLKPGADMIAISGLTNLTASPGSITPTPPKGTAWQAGLADGQAGKYIKLYETVTGRRFKAPPPDEPVKARIRRNLTPFFSRSSRP